MVELPGGARVCPYPELAFAPAAGPGTPPLAAHPRRRTLAAVPLRAERPAQPLLQLKAAHLWKEYTKVELKVYL